MQFAQHGGVKAIKDVIMNTEEVTLQVNWWNLDITVTLGTELPGCYTLGDLLMQ